MKNENVEEKVETNVKETVVKEEKELQNKDEKTKKTKNQKAIIIGVILAIILIGGGITFYVLKVQNKQEYKDNVDNDKDREKDKDKPIEEENENYYKNPMQVYSYKNGDGSEILCVQNEYCDPTFVIYTNTLSAKVLSTAYDNYVLYSDIEIYLYNNDTGVSTKLDIDNTQEIYTLLYAADDSEIKELYGISYGTEKKQSFYSFENNKVLYKGKYSEFQAVDRNLISAVLNRDDFEGSSYLLDARTEKKPYISVDNYCVDFVNKKFGSNYFIEVDIGCTGLYEKEYYTKDYKKIEGDKSYELSALNDGKLYIGDANKKVVKQYDFDGKIVNNYNVDGELLSVHEDVYVVLKNDILYIKEYNGQEYKLMEWKKEYYYHYGLSGYYEENALYNEEEKAAGYYFIIGYGDGNETRNESGVEYFFDYNKKTLKSWKLPEIGGYAKPVLYLYPEKETKVTVNFEHEDNLTTTYPKFKDSWEVTAKPNGDLYDKDGKYYYGLYWEENSNHRVNFNEGFYVTKDNAISFLEEKLNIIGLSDKERNEFIMYWLPILEKNEQSIVYFELTEEREAFNKIDISPKPDSLLRVAIHVKKVNKKVNIKEQKLTPFKREGFTAVEWGGILYN